MFRGNKVEQIQNRQLVYSGKHVATTNVVACNRYLHCDLLHATLLRSKVVVAAKLPSVYPPLRKNDFKTLITSGLTGQSY